MKDKIPVQILENVCTGIFVWKIRKNIELLEENVFSCTKHAVTKNWWGNIYPENGEGIW